MLGSHRHGFQIMTKTTCWWLTHVWTVVTPYIIVPDILVVGVVLINNCILHDKPEITSFESIELVITLGSITIRLSVIYRMPPVKSKNGLKQGNHFIE